MQPSPVFEAQEDPAAFQRWKFVPVSSPDSLCEMNFRQLRTITLDFGRHITGHLVLRLKTMGDVMDAPVKLKFEFGETPAELCEPFDPWRGTLSRGCPCRLALCNALFAGGDDAMRYGRTGKGDDGGLLGRYGEQGRRYVLGGV